MHFHTVVHVIQGISYLFSIFFLAESKIAVKTMIRKAFSSRKIVIKIKSL